MVFKNGRFHDLYSWRSVAYNYWPVWTREVGCMLQILPIILVPLGCIVQTCRYLSSGPPDILDVSAEILAPTILFLILLFSTMLSILNFTLLSPFILPFPFFVSLLFFVSLFLSVCCLLISQLQVSKLHLSYRNFQYLSNILCVFVPLFVQVYVPQSVYVCQ
jgi:hypothetical protein